MYPVGDTNYGVASTLIYGAQWDTGYATDSTGKGNYSGTDGADDIASTSAPAECGARDGFRQKNIYDMAGNVWEWTMEKFSTNRVYRGGDYNYSGSDYPASNRLDLSVDGSSPHCGFRVGLYISSSES